MARIWTIESLNTLNDKQLLLALARGEDLALDCFFTRQSGKVLQYALRRKLAPEQADDIVQIVFLQLFRKKHLYDPKYDALAWLYVITRSELKDYRKRELKGSVVFEDSLSQSPEVAPNIDAQSEVSFLLQDLNPKQREAVEMRFLDDMEYAEISKLLNETESNVRQLISRALRILKKKGDPHV